MYLGEHRLEVMGCPSCALSLVGGLGGLGDDAEVQAEYPILNHLFAPFLGPTRYIRNVETLAQALAYAAGGFHVSVTRGLSGGCKDPSDGFMYARGLIDGMNTTPCAVALNNPRIRDAWANVAQKYLDAYNLGVTTKSLSKTKAAIQAAQSMMISPYAMEGVTPPRDPGPGNTLPEPAPEPPILQPPVTATGRPRKAMGEVAVMAAGGGVLAIGGLIAGIISARKKRRSSRVGI